MNKHYSGGRYRGKPFTISIVMKRIRVEKKNWFNNIRGKKKRRELIRNERIFGSVILSIKHQQQQQYQEYNQQISLKIMFLSNQLEKIKWKMKLRRKRLPISNEKIEEKRKIIIFQESLGSPVRAVLSPLHTNPFPLPVFGMEGLCFTIWRPVGSKWRHCWLSFWLACLI